MKRIIKGKLYDTETALEIGRYDNGALPDKFDWICETLYCKRTGEFFIHGEGGARTIYASSPRPDTWASGEAIVPLTYDDAREFAQSKLTTSEYEAAFGVPDDGLCGGNTECIRVYVPTRAKKLIALECQRTGETIAQVIARLAETLCDSNR